MAQPMGLFGAYDPALIQQQREDQLTKEAYMASQGGGAMLLFLMLLIV